MTTILKIIRFFRKVMYVLYLGCGGGLFVVFSQPKDAEIDKMFKIGLGIAIVLSLAVGFALKALDERMTSRISPQDD
jgi:hypothetical protein